MNAFRNRLKLDMYQSSADFLLQECTHLPDDLTACRQLHASLADMGLDTLSLVVDSLIRSFSACGSLSEADMLFRKAVKPSLYTWNSIVSAHSEFGDWDTTFAMYQQLQREGLRPDKFTFFAVLKACSASSMIQEGRLVHEHILICALESIEILAITYMDMYAKGGYLEDAHRVFECLPCQDVVQWNVMISGYAHVRESHCAFELYKAMLSKNMVPDNVTFACMLKVCCDSQLKHSGMSIHAEVVKVGLESNVVVGSALVDMHATFGCLESAHILFFKLPSPNLVSWNVILKGHVQSGNETTVLQLFERMQQQGVKPDKVTFLCVVKSCSTAANTHLGQVIHDHIIQSGLDFDLNIGHAIIDMYMKVGHVEDGRKVFDNLSRRDVVAWNAMLTGYLEHVSSLFVFSFFTEMQKEGIKGDEFSYACVAKACCNIGTIELGKSVHDQILRERIEIDVVLGNILIDMYSRCGSPEIAQLVLEGLSAPDALSWNALIAGYAMRGNTCMVDWCLESMDSQGFKPNGGTLTSILVACSHAGETRVGARYFYSMQKDYGITLNIEHFNTMVDMFGRTGCLDEAKALLRTMPLCVDVDGKTSLLAACKKYGDFAVETG